MLNDTYVATSEGGYGGDAFAPVAQRGLIDQSTEGMPLGNEIQDAYQGKDVEAAAQYNHEQSKHNHVQLFPLRAIRII